jgi:hypothetical protein
MAIWFTLFGAMPVATRGRWDLAGCPREMLPPVITPGIPRLPGDWLTRTGLMAWQLPRALPAGALIHRPPATDQSDYIRLTKLFPGNCLILSVISSRSRAPINSPDPSSALVIS